MNGTHLALVALLALATIAPTAAADLGDALDDTPSVDRPQAPRPSCDPKDPDPAQAYYCRTYTSFWILYDAYAAPIDAVFDCMGGQCPP